MDMNDAEIERQVDAHIDKLAAQYEASSLSKHGDSSSAQNRQPRWGLPQMLKSTIVFAVQSMAAYPFLAAKRRESNA